MSFYDGQAPLHVAAQLVMGGFFLFQGIKNVGRWQVNVGRMAALGIPKPALCLAVGFAIQFSGTFMVLLDWHRPAGVALLMLFTVLATAVFHRFWRMTDPVRAEYHFLLLTYNVFVIGALLLLL